MVPGRISLRRICTSRRIGSSAGSSSRNEAVRGSCTTSSPRMLLQTCQTRCVFLLRTILSPTSRLQVPELVSQRRRWLNGSFFAAIHSTVKFHYIYRSSHSFIRKFWIHIEMLYQTFNLIFSWFALGNYYIAFTILSNALEDPSFNLGGWIHVLNVILNYFYLGLLVMCFLISLGNRPQGCVFSPLFHTALRC